jgi:hypothetical protein
MVRERTARASCRPRKERLVRWIEIEVDDDAIAKLR